MNDRSHVAACDGVVRSGARSLHAEAVESLRSGAMPSAAAVPQAEAAAGSSQAPASPSTSAELEGLFWQSIMDSTSPAEFEASVFDDGSAVDSAGAVAARIAVPGALQGLQRTASDGARLQPAVPVFRRVDRATRSGIGRRLAGIGTAGRRGCGDLLRRNQLSGPCGGSALRRVLHRRPAHFGSL